MADPARRLATYEDVLAAPAHVVAEVVAGVLHTMSRPATPHANAASALGDELGPPFRRGRGGPGGWILLDEPELHLGADIVVPDLAGWRRERMPTVPNAAYLTLAPDWVCEVLSPSTAAFDRADKLPVYAREGVRHAWLVDPIARTLEVMRLEAQLWTLRGVFRDDVLVRAEPFDAIELELGALWADVARLATTTWNTSWCVDVSTRAGQDFLPTEPRVTSTVCKLRERCPFSIRPPAACT